MRPIGKKLWNRYAMQFPVKQEKVFVVGPNGSGKTHLFWLLKAYYEEQGKTIICFEDDRLFLLDPHETYELIQQHTPLRMVLGIASAKDGFLAKHNIDMKQLDLKEAYGEPIRSGKLQLVHFFSKIMRETKDIIVMIDEPERHLDLLTQETLVDDLLALPHVKQVIAFTHAPAIVDLANMVQIRDCIMTD